MTLNHMVLGAPSALLLLRVGTASQVEGDILYLQGDIWTLVLITLERGKGDPGMTTLAVVPAPLKMCVKKASTEGKGTFPMGQVFLRVSQLTLAHSTLPPALPTTKLSQSLGTVSPLLEFGGFFFFWRQEFQEAATVNESVLQPLCTAAAVTLYLQALIQGGWVILTLKDPLWLKK